MPQFFSARVRGPVNSSAHRYIDQAIAVTRALGTKDERCDFHMSDRSSNWPRRGDIDEVTPIDRTI